MVMARRNRLLLNACLAWIPILLLLRPCHSSTGNKRATAGGVSSSRDVGGIIFAGDPFVAAAPLIVAAVCNDGIAIVATHAAFSSEPLILDDGVSRESNETTTMNTVADNSNATSGSFPQDLPRSYRGPFRINCIDGFGTCLICAGWRADGEVMVNYCRAVASEELAIYGKPSFHNCEYGNFIASEASLFMAQCAVSESRRSLSCAGLLASRGSDDSGCPGGYLWLIDATGAYRVRAHALGGGLSPNGSQASTVNEQLSLTDFSGWTAQEGARELLKILSKKDVGLASETRVEIAIVGTKPRSGMKRLFSSTLFGIAT